MTTPAPKSITFISRHAPYGGDNAQVCLELVLAHAVYEQTINYLFLDDGVYQLLTSQQPDSINNKNLTANLQALALYGVEKVYVDRQSLEQRNLSASDLILAADILDSHQVSNLIRTADVVFSL
ncbi:MAG: sulfurtransferase complex subunit TusC [Gammaproteobacteria bacterium]|jgi:tRNA 2-thiouridine synthesizing protein C